jgi:DNA-binding MarR family transcriptional regulator
MVPSVLADRLGMTRGAISKLADRLSAKALLTRVPGTKDRRYQELALTAASRALVPELSGLADHNDAEFFGHLEPADRATVERVMKDIVRKLGLRAMPID